MGDSAVVELTSAELQVRVDTGRGGQIVRIGAPDGPNHLFAADWRAPLPASGALSYPDSRADWLSHWRGGWQELFPNAGAECRWGGVVLPHHGEVSRVPWRVVDRTADRLVISTPTRLPLVLTRTMRVSGADLLIDEVVVNESDLPTPVRWTHHPAFDAPPGTRVHLAAGDMVVPPQGQHSRPRLQPGTYRWPDAVAEDGRAIDVSTMADERTQRMIYRPDVASPWAAIERPDGWVARLAWEQRTFPHVAVWTQIREPSFPSYGRGRVVAVEPCSAWPGDGLAGAVERNQALLVPPNGEIRTALSASISRGFPPGEGGDGS